VGHHLSSENKMQMWVPEGFAHGFLVLSSVAEVHYKATNYYAPEQERSIAWNDASLAIEWPTSSDLSLSEKDSKAPLLSENDCLQVDWT
jgi:dTDP-4-dehydrorhamnose 3,5-epimerase